MDKSNAYIPAVTKPGFTATFFLNLDLLQWDSLVFSLKLCWGTDLWLDFIPAQSQTTKNMEMMKHRSKVQF